MSKHSKKKSLLPKRFISKPGKRSRVNTNTRTVTQAEPLPAPTEPISEPLSAPPPAPPARTPSQRPPTRRTSAQQILAPRTHVHLISSGQEPDDNDFTSASGVQTQHAPVPSQRKPRNRGFMVSLIVFSLLVLSVISAGAFYLWDYLEAFEISRPEHTIEQVKDSIDTEFWRQSAENALAARLTQFESDAKAALEPHLPQILNVSYSMRKNPNESTDNLLIYTIRAGALDIGTMRLVPAGQAGHGLSIWGVDSVRLLDSFLASFSRSITITASEHALVEVNGITVTEEYRIECEYEYGKSYKIDNIYGQVEVSVIEVNGDRLHAISAENDEYLFEIAIPYDIMFNIVVPHSATVFADGDRISTDMITDSQVIPPIFDGVVDSEQVPSIASSRYEFEFTGMFIDPFIRVTNASGVTLEETPGDEGELIFKQVGSEALKEAHEETVDEFIRSYIRFSSNVGGSPSNNFSALSRYVQRNSGFLRRLQETSRTGEWGGAAQITIHELEYYNFVPYGDSYFTAEVYYHLTKQIGEEEIDVEMHYLVLFVQYENRWLAANMLET